jgi:hypothetical protein
VEEEEEEEVLIIHTIKIFVIKRPTKDEDRRVPFDINCFGGLLLAHRGCPVGMRPSVVPGARNASATPCSIELRAS